MKGKMIKLDRAITCPCCGQGVGEVSCEMVVDSLSIPRQQARILGAIWKGRGHPVHRDRIFDAMYADDLDGGPSARKARDALKLALHYLRLRLDGTGIGIETIRQHGEYRLKLERISK